MVEEIDAIERDIEQTRQDLGATVEALSRKLDVKARAREQIDVSLARATAAARERPALLGGVAVLTAVLTAAFVAWRRH